MKNNIFKVYKNFDKTYTFILTKITVYSFEEFLYHIFHYPKSFYDFNSIVFKSFIRENLLNIDEEIVNIVEKSGNPFDKMINIILKYSHLYDSKDLINFQERISDYSKKNQVELQKEVGEDLLENGEYLKAKELYQKLLDTNTDSAILNNYGYACVKIGFIPEAEFYFEKACKISNNKKIFYNYVKLLLQQKKTEKAMEVIEFLDDSKSFGYKTFLSGLIYLKNGDFTKALELFEQSLNIEYTEECMTQYVDLIIKVNKIDFAHQVVDKYLSKTDFKFYEYKAKIYKENGQIYDAIKTLKEVYKIANDEKTKIEILTFKSKLYRENYDFKNATKTIQKALSIKNSNTNSKLLLELALINKSNGNMTSYKDTVNKLITNYKQSY